MQISQIILHQTQEIKHQKTKTIKDKIQIC